MLAIFTSTILGLILDPLPVGAWALIAVTVTLATNTLTFAQVRYTHKFSKQRTSTYAHIQSS